MALPFIGAGAAVATTLAATIIAFLAEAIKGLVGRVLVALGIGIVTATGINALLNGALGFVQFQNMGNVDFQAAISATGLPWFLSTILSAITVRATLKGLASDNASFFVMRRSIG